MSELLKAIESVGDSFNVLKQSNETRFNKFEKRIDEIQNRVESGEAERSRPGRTGGAASAERKALAEFMRTGRGLDAAEGKSMTIGATADGGALVPELIADDIVSRALGRGGLAKIVRFTKSPTSDYVRLLNMRGQNATWIAEAGTRSATNNFKLREVRPTHGEIYAAVTVSNWLLNDAKFPVDRMIVDNFTEQMARALETAVYSGNGSSQPTGINTSAVATADSGSPERDADAIELVSGTSSGLGDNLIQAFFTLRPEYRRNATWVMSSASLSKVRQLRDANGSGYLWQASLGDSVDFTDGRLLGKPVVCCEDMSTLGDGSPQVQGVLVGDFLQAYELVQIGDLQIVRDPYSARGFTTVYLAARFGGRLVDNDAVKLLAA